MHMAIWKSTHILRKLFYLVFIGSFVFSTHLGIYRPKKIEVLYTSCVDVLCEVVES